MAEIKFFCPHCKQKTSCAELWGGHQLQCPSCQREVTVPQSEAAPAPAPPPPPVRVSVHTHGSAGPRPPPPPPPGPTPPPPPPPPPGTSLRAWRFTAAQTQAGVSRVQGAR